MLSPSKRRHFGGRTRLPIRYKSLEEDQTSTPARLRARAAQLKARAEATYSALTEEAAALERAADEIDAARAKGRPRRYQSDGLSSRDQAAIVTTVTTDADTGLAISRGKSRSSLAKVMNAAGFSFPKLAAAVSRVVKRPITDSTLKMGFARGPIERDVAEAVQQLTRSDEFPLGFEASSRNWPKIND